MTLPDWVSTATTLQICHLLLGINTTNLSCYRTTVTRINQTFALVSNILSLNKTVLNKLKLCRNLIDSDTRQLSDETQEQFVRDVGPDITPAKCYSYKVSEFCKVFKT